VIFERVGDGLRLTIDDHSREVVVHLLGELRTEVQSAKEAAHDELPAHMKRLFPTAYHADHALNTEYRRLTHGDLSDAHLAAIDDATALLAPGRIFTLDDLGRFVRAINSMRLVLGTLLDVSESDRDDPSDDDPAAAQRQVYDYLGWLLQESLDELRA
jgi:hypothetical protein